MTQPAELYACVYAREFPAQSQLRLRPELRDRPSVVMEGERPSQFLCSLNRQARSRGLRPGMTGAEVDRFPDAVQLARSRKTEAETRAILLQCAGEFSPRVEDRSEDTAFLCAIDIAGTASLFGPTETLARELLRRVRALHVSASITASSNVHAAVCLAKGLSPHIPFHLIPPGAEASTLAPLPLTVLDLTEKQAKTFERWGIRTLGMLAELPQADLIARMGQPGHRLRQLARGECPHLFQPVEPVFALAEQRELDSPVEDREALLFVISLLLDQLIQRAKSRVFALAAVTVTLQLEGGGIYTRGVRPALPTNDKQLWVRLLHLDLEAHPPSAAILAVRLNAEPGSTTKVQLGLFSPQLPEPARLDVMLAHLRSIVGDDGVGCAVLLDTHAPEAFRLEPFCLPSGDSVVEPRSLPFTALRQLRPPESAAITFSGHRPTHFFFRGQRYAVNRAYGPWLTGGDWWTESVWGQEHWELVAQADTNALICCLTRDRIENTWQVTALYD